MNSDVEGAGIALHICGDAHIYPETRAGDGSESTVSRRYTGDIRSTHADISGRVDISSGARDRSVHIDISHQNSKGNGDCCARPGECAGIAGAKLAGGDGELHLHRLALLHRGGSHCVWSAESRSSHNCFIGIDDAGPDIPVISILLRASQNAAGGAGFQQADGARHRAAENDIVEFHGRFV